MSLLSPFILFVTASPCAGITWPIQGGRSSAPVTSPFGPRCDGFTGKIHAGIDVRIWSSRNVVAVTAGTVEEVSTWSGYDWTVILNHGSGDNTWYTGYHHMNTDEDIDVVTGQSVTEGQITTKAGSNHLHFNYWGISTTAPTDDDNTLHPLRILGGGGKFYICVRCACTPVSALQIDHFGQLVEAGVGVGSSPYSNPYYTYVWNYEGNVRSYTYTYGLYVPGYCYLGADLYTGVSPSSFDPDAGTFTYFTFPAEEGDWILNNSPYTYALSVDGTRITIEEPVSDFFESLTATVSETEVTVRWDVVRYGMEPGDFMVYRGTSSELLSFVHMDVQKESAKSFQFTDGDIEKGCTYYYRITWHDCDKSISAGILEVQIPGRNSISLGVPYPNPFQGMTFARCDIPPGREFNVSVYDVRGSLVKKLHRGSSAQNEFSIMWDGTNTRGEKVAGGCYFFRLAVRGHAPIVKKAVLLE